MTSDKVKPYTNEDVLRLVAEYYAGYHEEGFDFLWELIEDWYPQIKIKVVGYDPEGYLDNLISYLYP